MLVLQGYDKKRTINFYFQSIKNNEAVIEFVSTTIGSSVLLQKCLLQAYVDEKYLDSFLGKWFDAIEESTIPDLLLFKNLLLCQKAFTIKEMDKAKSHFKLALKQYKKLSVPIHPILKARIGVWELLLNKDKEKLTYYFNSLTNPFDKADFAVIASRLLWTFHDEKAPISFLDAIAVKEFPPVKDFFQKGRFNVLLLTLAIHHSLKHEHQQSNAYFKLFSTTTFGYDIVNIDYYLPWIAQLNL